MMSLLKSPLKLVDGLFDRIFAVVGAVVTSQFPAFVSHYVQRLSGHVGEAQRNVADWRKIADAVAGGSIDRMLQMAQTGEGQFGIEAAKKCAADVARLDHLLNALDAIKNAPIWKKGLVFLHHVDFSIARATLKDYVPNIPLDAESLGYALAGMVLAVVAYHALKSAARISYLAIRRRSSRTEPSAGSEPT